MLSTNSGARDRIILCVDLDYFYAQCEEVRHPDLKGKPVVICVYSGRTETSGAVSTANYVARRLGIKSGIPIVSAKKILKDKSDAVFLPMDREYYESVSERIMSTVSSYSADFEQVSIDEAFVDLTNGSEGSFEKAKILGQKLKVKIYEGDKLTCSVGIGPNKLIAKMAADFKKPDGLTVIQPSDIKNFLSPMPVRQLYGIGPKMERQLKGLRILTIGELGLASELKLTETFGKNLGPELKRLAQGIDESPVKEREIEQLSRIITLKKNAETFDFQTEVEPLCDDISNRLKERSLACKNIGIIIITTELRTRSRSRTLNAPTDESKIILEECSKEFREFFETEDSIKKETARRVGVRVSNLASRNRAPGGASESNYTLSDFTNV